MTMLAAPPAQAVEDDPSRVPRPKTEVDGVPIVGGDSDIGVGAGALGAITRLEPGRKPYLWRLEAGLLATFKPPTSDAGLRLPYQDYYLLLTLPYLAGKALRLEVRPSFTKETTQRYYGIGNDSPAPSPDGPQDEGSSYYQYGRLHASLAVRARLRLTEHLFLLVGDTYTYNRLDVPADSKLGADFANTANTEVRSMLGDTRPHGVNFFEYGILFDNRDNEIWTRRGTYDQLKIRLSPSGPDGLPYRYGQVDAILRAYVPIGSRVVLAARLVADVQFGDPPFYELARYEDTFALGGSNGVRGVPGQRYYGKVKAFGNFEVRSTLFDFRLFDKKFALGATAFFDAGRAWTELGSSHPALDGTGLGLKYGTGVGLRLHQGQAFVVRGDIAWSPDAQPIGGYFTAGEMF
ncbi:BamA/TamA family outer membrane protein [Pendulispora albinea]|uniref:Outer membrane protein assembly factor n=1 Tax=Pendulispora albinea TaxID=2741071 RepID=A0ABZ2LNV0_9BACT